MPTLVASQFRRAASDHVNLCVAFGDWFLLTFGAAVSDFGRVIEQ
jgi:hypothetical protein